jgi:uncharacterized protein YwlG (UPF0340 family)
MTIRTGASLAVAGGLIAALCTGIVSGCASKNVSCTVNSCTVTLDRGVDAGTSVLGIDVKLIEVKDEQIILDVGGTRATLPSTGAETQVGGLTMKVDQVTGDQVVIDVNRGDSNG